MDQLSCTPPSPCLDRGQLWQNFGRAACKFFSRGTGVDIQNLTPRQIWPAAAGKICGYRVADACSLQQNFLSWLASRNLSDHFSRKQLQLKSRLHCACCKPSKFLFRVRLTVASLFDSQHTDSCTVLHKNPLALLVRWLLDSVDQVGLLYVA